MTLCRMLLCCVRRTVLNGQIEDVRWVSTSLRNLSISRVATRMLWAVLMAGLFALPIACCVATTSCNTAVDLEALVDTFGSDWTALASDQVRFVFESLPTLILFLPHPPLKQWRQLVGVSIRKERHFDHVGNG